jgi:hypothetical protein
MSKILLSSLTARALLLEEGHLLNKLAVGGRAFT